MTKYIIIAIVVIILIWAVATYNKLINLRMKVKESFSTIDVFLKKRYDLIPNLVETVKGYATHEKTTLNQVVEARNRAVSAGNVIEKDDIENNLRKEMLNLIENNKGKKNFYDLSDYKRKFDKNNYGANFFDILSKL